MRCAFHHDRLREIAPVNAPFSWPNSSLSIRPLGNAAQFTFTRGLSFLGLRLWTARAMSSLPVPVSPAASSSSRMRIWSSTSRSWTWEPKREGLRELAADGSRADDDGPLGQLGEREDGLAGQVTGFHQPGDRGAAGRAPMAHLLDLDAGARTSWVRRRPGDETGSLATTSRPIGINNRLRPERSRRSRWPPRPVPGWQT